jgi:hypothetical protein
MVCVAEELKAEARELFGLSDDRVVVIPNGRDPGQYRPRDPSPEAGASRSIEPPAGPVLVWVGNLDEGKRPEWFFETVRHLRASGHDPLVARVVGAGPLEERLRSQAAESGIEMTGRRSDVAEILAGSDLLVFTSVSEGMPGVLIEAGLCGLAVVTTEVSGSRTVVRDGETGYVVPVDDRQALIARVAELINDPERRRRMGVAAREHCCEHFSLEAGARSWQRALDSLLGRPPSPNISPTVIAGAVVATKKPEGSGEMAPTTVLAMADVSMRRTPGGSVLMARPGPHLDPVRLDATGPLIWDLIDGERSLGDIAESLASRLGADVDEVLHDVTLTARHLCELGVAVPR